MTIFIKALNYDNVNSS